jgi:hypothetical protein
MGACDHGLLDITAARRAVNKVETDFKGFTSRNDEVNP